MSEDPTRIELLHQKDVSSVSAIPDNFLFPPTSLLPAMQLAPKLALASFLSFFAPMESSELLYSFLRRVYCTGRCITQTVSANVVMRIRMLMID